MELQKLLDKTTIAFDKPLFNEGVFPIFDYIASNSECNIRFNSRTTNSFMHYQDGIIASTYIIEIKGHIEKLFYDNQLGTVLFECIQEPITRHAPSFQEGAFYGIKFTTPPGFGVEQFPEEQIRLMDSVRKSVENYFISKESSELKRPSY
jgi:hypothetical protein